MSFRIYYYLDCTYQYFNVQIRVFNLYELHSWQILKIHISLFNCSSYVQTNIPEVLCINFGWLPQFYCMEFPSYFLLYCSAFFFLTLISIIIIIIIIIFFCVIKSLLSGKYGNTCLQHSSILEEARSINQSTTRAHGDVCCSLIIILQPPAYNLIFFG